MSPAEYRKLIHRLGLTQQQAGWLLGYSDRTSRAWLSGRYKIPPSTAIALRLMNEYSIPPERLTSL